jgi:TPR repeat protein
MTWMTMGTYVAYPYYGGVPEEECVKYLTRAANHGITLAIVYLGLHYYDHKKDYEKALPWLRIAALRGFSSEVQLSCALSILSLPNRPVEEIREAGRWLRLARDNGNPRAAEFLARLQKK